MPLEDGAATCCQPSDGKLSSCCDPKERSWTKGKVLISVIIIRRQLEWEPIQS